MTFIEEGPGGGPGDAPVGATTDLGDNSLRIAAGSGAISSEVSSGGRNNRPPSRRSRSSAIVIPSILPTPTSSTPHPLTIGTPSTVSITPHCLGAETDDVSVTVPPSTIINEESRHVHFSPSTLNKRRRLRTILSGEFVESVMALVVLAHFVFIAVETERRWRPNYWPMSKYEYFHSYPWLTLIIINASFSFIYLIELILWAIADPRYFCRFQHYRFNAAMCVLSWISDLCGVMAIQTLNTTPRDLFQVIGALRVLRVFYAFGRRYGAVIVVRGFLFALQALAKTAIVGAITLYLFANIAVRIFARGILGEKYSPELTFRWGSLSAALNSNLLMLTFDGWSDLAFATQDVYQGSPPFFVLFIATTGVVLLSVVTSAMVQAFIDASRALHADEHYRQQISKERQTLKSLRDLLDRATQSVSKAMFPDDLAASLAGSGSNGPQATSSCSSRLLTTQLSASTLFDENSGKLNLSGKSADALAEEMQSSLEAADVSLAAATDAIELFKRFGMNQVSPEEMAAACTWVGDDGSGRQLLVAQVENQKLHDGLAAKVAQLQEQAAETDRLVSELAKRLSDVKRASASTLNPPPPVAPPKQPVPHMPPREVPTETAKVLYTPRLLQKMTDDMLH